MIGKIKKGPIRPSLRPSGDRMPPCCGEPAASLARQAGRRPVAGQCPWRRDAARLTCSVNSVQARGLTSITGPLGSVESRTATSAWPVPTSTQLPLERL